MPCDAPGGKEHFPAQEGAERNHFPVNEPGLGQRKLAQGLPGGFHRVALCNDGDAGPGRAGPGLVWSGLVWRK